MQVVNTTLAPRYGDLMPRAPSEHDAHLLARIVAGDDRALAEVYDEHTAVVYGVARRVTCNEHIARDVCQEVFAYLWEMPSRVDLTKGSLRAYLAMLVPEKEHTALRLAYFDGLSYRQVAAALGIAEGTAKSRLRVGLGRLRTLLDADFRAAI